MTNLFFLILCLVTHSVSNGVVAQNTPKEDLELEGQLNIVNKLPVKSIHTEFGDIIDCINIYQQPAFDHPLLKNHRLQRKPTFQKSIGKTRIRDSSVKPILGLQKHQCPINTIPIRRTVKDNFIQAKPLLNYHIKTANLSGVHVAEVTLPIILNRYAFYGVKGNTVVYNPKVVATDNQMSAAYLWVANGPIDTNNKIFAGWHVAPQEYKGDTSSFIFTAWTSDNFLHTGCINLDCPGFVQTSKEIYPGIRVSNPSTNPGNKSLAEVEVSIRQDEKTKNWWLNLEDKDIGYFPAELFSNLSLADSVGWGGRTGTSGTLSPPMGSGLFPTQDFTRSAYFRQISFLDYQREEGRPDKDIVNAFTDNPNCYRIEFYGDIGGQAGDSLQFGGPGGNCSH